MKSSKTNWEGSVSWCEITFKCLLEKKKNIYISFIKSKNIPYLTVQEENIMMSILPAGK